MRKIKFRVFNKYKGNYTFVGYETVHDGDWFFSRDGKDWQDGVFKNKNRFDVEIIRTQFIGFVDEDGIEIYEGDILRQGDWEGEVSYHEETGGFFCLDKHDEDKDLDLVKDAVGLKVVGNIYASSH